MWTTCQIRSRNSLHQTARTGNSVNAVTADCHFPNSLHSPLSHPFPFRPSTTKTPKNLLPSPKMPVISAPVLRGDDMDTDPPPESPIPHLPHDALHKIFSLLSLRQALLCRSVCRSFRDSLISPPPLPTLKLLALRNNHRHSYPHHLANHLTAFDPDLDKYLRFPLSFLHFASFSPITSCNSLLYLWADAVTAPNPNPDQKNPKSLVVCNPLTRSYKVLPQLGSAWSRHGTVLVGPAGVVLVLTELAALYYSPRSNGSSWLKYSLNLPSKPRSPILMERSIFTLCDVGSPWRSQWKLFCCRVEELKGGRGWIKLEKHEWGDVFDVLKRPRLVRGGGKDEILMVGGLRSSFAVDSPCSTVLILRLNLERMEWDEAGRMPPEMYRCFASGGAQGGGPGNNKVKVFGGEGRVWFSGKRVRGKMAMWEEEGGEVEDSSGGGNWRWVEGFPGYGDGVYRGFVFDAGLNEIP